MAATIDKAVKDLMGYFKKEKFPDTKNKTFFDTLKKNLTEEGPWDDDLLDQTKEKIINWLSGLKKKDLESIWNDSQSADVGEYNGIPESETVLDELSEELLDLILEQVEELTPREEFFIDESKKNKNFDEEDDDDFEVDFSDDIFDEDEFDDFDNDDFDDDRY